tara:strand:- start:135 stop:392 length:258 start_codon:yes stop_codon:yes gene_type:complete
MTVDIQRIVASFGALPIVVRTEYHDEVELLRVLRDIFFPTRAPRLAMMDAALRPSGELRGELRGGDDDEEEAEEDGPDLARGEDC